MAIKGLPAEGDFGDVTVSIDEAISAVPFEPKEAIKCLRNFYSLFKDNGIYTSSGIVTSVHTPTGEVSLFFSDAFFPPINVLLIENYRSELIWDLAKSAPEYQESFKNAGLKFINKN